MLVQRLVGPDSMVSIAVRRRDDCVDDAANVRTCDGRAVFFTTNVLPVVTPPPGVIVPVPLPRSITQHVALSLNHIALTIGGGLDARLAWHVSVNADLRYYRLLGQEDSTIGRFGAGIRYRF